MKLIIGQRGSGKSTELIREILAKPGQKLVICTSAQTIGLMKNTILKDVCDSSSLTMTQNRMIFKLDGAMYDIVFVSYSQLGGSPIGNQYVDRDIFVDEIGWLMQRLILGESKTRHLTATLNDGNGCGIKYLEEGD